MLDKECEEFERRVWGRDLIDACALGCVCVCAGGTLAQVMMKLVAVQPRKLEGTEMKQEMNLS